MDFPTNVFGLYEIEAVYGLARLIQFNSEMAMVKSGVPYTALGMSQQRERSRPAIYHQEVGIVKNGASLSDTYKNGSIAVLKYDGVMLNDGGACSHGIKELASQIEEANQNRSIAGILIDLNTGGGEKSAGITLQNSISSSDKAVGIFTEYLASAGIRGALHADVVIAKYANAQIGSIGTYMEIDNEFVKLYQEKFTAIYAADSTDKNYLFLQIMAKNLPYLQEKVNESNNEFLAEVRSRKMLQGDEATIKHTLSGAMFNANEAKDRGLIDGIGNFNYAISRLMTYVEKRKKM